MTYLLGLLDVDPDQAVLDKSWRASCGPVAVSPRTELCGHLRSRHPQGTSPEVVEVPGVGHDGPRMFESPCGVRFCSGCR